jgi:hypothetical protein
MEARVRPETIVRLFESSQLAFLGSVLLMLASPFSVRRMGDLTPLAGVSWRALELNLIASVSRVYFQWATHFYEHWFACFESALSILSLVALVAALHVGATIESARPRESFPTSLAVMACLAAALVLGALDEGGIVYASLAFSVFLEVRMAVARAFASLARITRSLLTTLEGAFASLARITRSLLTTLRPLTAGGGDARTASHVRAHAALAIHCFKCARAACARSRDSAFHVGAHVLRGRVGSGADAGGRRALRVRLGIHSRVCSLRSRRDERSPPRHAPTRSVSAQVIARRG